MITLDDTLDHVRGPADAPVILEYGDYECPYSRKAFREIESVERERPGGIRFAFRHFPLTEIHPHALAAAAFGCSTAFAGGARFVALELNGFCDAVSGLFERKCDVAADVAALAPLVALPAAK